MSRSSLKAQAHDRQSHEVGTDDCLCRVYIGFIIRELNSVMLRASASPPSLSSSQRGLRPRAAVAFRLPHADGFTGALILGMILSLALPARGVVLWTDPDTTVAHENGAGKDI